MPDPYIGEVRMFGSDYAPQGWALCDGRTLPVHGNETLFSLLGATYGGDGISNFGLPDLRSRIPIGQGKSTEGTSYALAQKGGQEAVVLSPAQIPHHTHTLMASSAPATTASPANNYLAASVNSSGLPHEDAHYVSASAPVLRTLAFNLKAVSSTGENVTHPNIMPSFCVNFIIALAGAYPSFP